MSLMDGNESYGVDNVSHEELMNIEKSYAEALAKLARLREALEEIAEGPYNGFEQCKAIARNALKETK